MTTQQKDITASPPAERKGHWCCAEFSIGMFELKEQGGKGLDMDCLLNIGKGVLSLSSLLKVIFLGVSISGLVRDIEQYRHPDFYLAYLTSWTMVHCITYLTASLLLTILPPSSPYSGKNSYLMKFTWLYHSLAVVHGTVVTILFWVGSGLGIGLSLLHKPGDGVGYSTVMSHGGVALLCALNGLVVDRTPIRLKHVFINLVWAFLYLLWTVLHNTIIQYNPYDDDDDDAIYDILTWRKNQKSSIILAVIVILVAIPFFQTLFWAISLPRRVYVVEDEEGGTVHDSELGEGGGVIIYQPPEQAPEQLEQTKVY